MSDVSLEKFSIAKVATQAPEVSGLVNEEWFWLRRVQPNTIAAYRTPFHAGLAIASRVLKHPELKAFIVRKQEAAIGLATIISNQRVIHPTKGLFEGYDLDYWTKLGEDRITQRNVVTALIKKADAIHYRPLNVYFPVMLDGSAKFPEFRAMASVVAGRPNRRVGFEENPHMVPVGDATNLSTDLVDDRYDMARGGKLAQLYVYSKEPLSYSLESN